MPLMDHYETAQTTKMAAPTAAAITIGIHLIAVMNDAGLSASVT